MAETREQWKARLGIGQPSTVAQLAGGAGTTRTSPVPRDDAPGVAGTRTEHWDGRVDATARATVHVNPNLRASR
jgi:hypothetical protein